MFMRYWFLKEFQIYGVYIVYLNSLRVLALYYTKDLPTRPNREVHTVRLQVAPGASTDCPCSRTGIVMKQSFIPQ